MVVKVYCIKTHYLIPCIISSRGPQFGSCCCRLCSPELGRPVSLRSILAVRGGVILLAEHRLNQHDEKLNCTTHFYMHRMSRLDSSCSPFPWGSPSSHEAASIPLHNSLLLLAVTEEIAEPKSNFNMQILSHWFFHFHRIASIFILAGMLETFL